MGKLKTHKAAVKRLHPTRRGKILKRKAGQDHFNSRESGTTRMNKRRDVLFSSRFVKTAKRAMPYT